MQENGRVEESTTKREYLKAIHARDRSGSRKQQLILDEFCSACGYHPKHAG